jgi:tRNA A37 methylthiotransferase MiaB
MQNGLVEIDEIKRRSNVAAQLAKRISLERNKHWVDWVGEILVDEKGKVEGSWVGRNFAYKPIVVRSSGDLLGKTVMVKVLEASASCLKGAIVEL